MPHPTTIRGRKWYPTTRTRISLSEFYHYQPNKQACIPALHFARYQDGVLLRERHTNFLFFMSLIWTGGNKKVYYYLACSLLKQQSCHFFHPILYCLFCPWTAQHTHTRPHNTTTKNLYKLERHRGNRPHTRARARE